MILEYIFIYLLVGLILNTALLAITLVQSRAEGIEIEIRWGVFVISSVIWPYSIGQLIWVLFRR